MTAPPARDAPRTGPDANPAAPLRPALAELVALLAACRREDWTPETIRAVLIDIGNRGVPFAVAMREAVQLACIPGSAIAELRDRHPGSDPLRRHRPATPDAAARAARHARDTLTATRKEISNHDHH